MVVYPILSTYDLTSSFLCMYDLFTSLITNRDVSFRVTFIYFDRYQVSKQASKQTNNKLRLLASWRSMLHTNRYDVIVLPQDKVSHAHPSSVASNLILRYA